MANYARWKFQFTGFVKSSIKPYLSCMMDDFNNLELHGRRVTLQAIKIGDVNKLYAIIRDSREHLEKWLPWVDFIQSLEDERHIIEQWIYDMQIRAAIHLSIKAEDEVVGMVSTGQIDWTNQRTSIGYWIKKESVRQNFASEATAILLTYLFDNLRLHRIFIQAATDNDASNGVIRKLGFKIEGVLRENERIKNRFLDHNIYGMTEMDYGQLKDSLHPFLHL